MSKSKQENESEGAQIQQEASPQEAGSVADRLSDLLSTDVERLVQPHGTVGFLGVSDGVSAEYPDGVDLKDKRMVDVDDPTNFKEALEVLPHPSKNDLWADNKFAVGSEDGSSVTVKTDEIRDVHGLDAEEIEQQAGMSLEEIVAQTDPEPLIPVLTDKGIIDDRRLALRTLGADCKFRWQIASNTYHPGNMREFFKRKIAACQQHGAEDMFGWIRHYDYGGSVTITTIYPSKAYEVGIGDETDIDISGGEIAVADNPLGEGYSELQSADTDDDTVTIYYGDRIGYDFSGTQTLWAKPVIFIPSVNTMIPIPYDDTDLRRKHTDNIMEDAIEYHEKILTKLDRISGTINEHVIRSRVAAIDFEAREFGIEEFYRLIGVHTEAYREEAAKRVRRFANPATKPTLWNLQLSLKVTLLNEFEGKKAGRQYKMFQELAGKMLKKPATVIQNAIEQHRFEQAQKDDEDEAEVEDDQMTLAESLGDVLELDGVTENKLDASEAQRIEEEVQQRLSDDIFEDGEGDVGEDEEDE